MDASERDTSKPDYTDTHVEAGREAFNAGDIGKASAICKSIIAHQAGNADALQLLSAIELSLGNFERAESAASDAVSIAPDNPFFRNSLGLAYQAKLLFDRALIEFEHALRLSPAFTEALTNKAAVLMELDRLQEAETCLDMALNVAPSNFTALLNKGSVLTRLGRVDQAFSMFLSAGKIDPSSWQALRNQISLVNYSPVTTQLEIQDITNRYWDLFPHTAKPRARPSEKRGIYLSPEKSPLRIGYVSADFRDHTIGHLFKPVLDAHLRSDFHVTLYSNNGHSDDLTHALISTCDDWRLIEGKTDQSVFDQIQRDEIDILVDLSGFTDGHRLSLFRLKPAPIQMTWLGYFSTTGLKEMDYIIADETVLPREDEQYFVETPLRLPNSYFCFQPPKNTPPLAAPPSTNRPFITFGCLNNTVKLNAKVLAAWRTVMDAVPDCRLLIKAANLTSPYKKQNTLDLLAENEIDTNRVQLLGRTDRERHMLTYNDVDIALDPFPFGGGITSLESLWMGIPLVTLQGDRWVSRVTASILKAAGLTETIADSQEEYVEIAVKLAENRAALQNYRKNARVIMASSPLSDADRCTRALERHYRDAWRTLCTG